MTRTNLERLPKEIFQIDERIKLGWYSDEYLNNTQRILSSLALSKYKFGEHESDLENVDTSDLEIGNLIVEMQFFTRRKPFSVVVGVDEALAILETGTGYYDGELFINTYDNLEVEAVHDGDIVYYDGNIDSVQPVLKIRGRYRDFSHLETVLLGVVSEPTRIATNVFNTLKAARGKDVLFFPARFAHYKMQGAHGYAHRIAVETYNRICIKDIKTFVSTHEQGAWWGGKGGGTVAHATIASFLGNTAETMMQFSKIMPVTTPRIALVDFHNDCVTETLKVMDKMFEKYWEYYLKADVKNAKKYILYGVRPDTSGNMIDRCIEEPSSKEDFGVNAKLVWKMRKEIDNAYISWIDKNDNIDIKIAKEWCVSIKIVVTGGFTIDKISMFEKLGVPVDIYGVGSSLLINDRITNNDYTADVVRVKIKNEWHSLSKVGRMLCHNKDLLRIK